MAVYSPLTPATTSWNPGTDDGGSGDAYTLGDTLTFNGATVTAISTPLYASPQQQRGEKPDPRDDVHALGVIGYQMLVGRLDVAPGADYARTLRKLGVGDELIELIGDCAAHDPEHRPANGALILQKSTSSLASVATASAAFTRAAASFTAD